MRGVIESPGGLITFEADGDSVTGIWLGRHGEPDAGPVRGVARDARDQLREYVQGKRRTFDLPLAVDAPPFSKRVLEEVATIPWGEARSYGEVAAMAGNPKGARAVGNAVGANRHPIVIPCHRVLAAKRKIGGFGGGLRWKRWLLAHEGIRAND